MWLGGLPPMITEYAVLQLIRQFGNLTDFHFPVHRTGDARGSTVGYCFVAYDTSETAKKALKALNGLKFHGHTLIARPAKPTHDELSLLQRANEEATRLRIMEETKLREAELAARLQKVDGPESTQETDLPILQMKPHKDQFTNPSLTEQACSPGSAHYLDMRGKLGCVNPGSTSKQYNCRSKVQKNAAGCRLFMQKIESALKRLENSPVGGPALLQPASATQRSLVPAGILAKHSNSSNAGFTRGRPSSLHRSSGIRRLGTRFHPRRL
ncbi:unnamed protein product [Dicrocoelium dendriticum]|nr:unnamed protein product [Dicrocoelium dendriticum]